MSGPGRAADRRRTALLEARARELARPVAEAPAQAAAGSVRFSCGGAAYAVDAARVDEVLPCPELLAVPGAPPALAGVFVHRGRVVAAVDPAGLHGDEARRRALVIVLDVPRAALGVVADELASAEAGDRGALDTTLDPDALATDARVVMWHEPD